jgi:hypothetical protein
MGGVWFLRGSGGGYEIGILSEFFLDVGSGNGHLGGLHIDSLGASGMRLD